MGNRSSPEQKKRKEIRELPVAKGPDRPRGQHVPERHVGVRASGSALQTPYDDWAEARARGQAAFARQPRCTGPILCAPMAHQHHKTSPVPTIFGAEGYGEAQATGVAFAKAVRLDKHQTQTALRRQMTGLCVGLFSRQVRRER